MGSYNQIDLRKADWRDFSDPDIGAIIRQLKNTPYDPWIWEFILADEEVVDGAAHEIRVDFTDEFNEEAAPKILAIQGAAANEDKAGGTGARSIIVFTIDTNGNPCSEVIAMHATPGTLNDGVILHKRFIGGRVYTAGSGKVNAGKIEIINHADNKVYGTIAAGENATIGARVYVPANYNAILTMKAGIVGVNHGTDVLEAYDGVIVKPVYSANPSILATGIYYVPVGSVGMIDLGITKQVIVGADTFYISFLQSTKSDDSNQTVVYHIKIIMFGTTNTLRGLGA